MNVAYWISPKGEIIDVKTKHIAEVIANPEKFGFNTEFIEYVYDNYNERIGQEGKAREQIMTALFNQGWVRIRKYKDFWSINVKQLAGKIKSYVTQWAKMILKGIHGFKEDDKYAMVKIDQKGKTIKTTDVLSMSLSDTFVAECILVERKIDELDNLKLYDIVNEIMRGKRKLFSDYINS